MQTELTNATNLKDKLEERLQIITEEAKLLKVKQEEYSKQMRLLFEKVLMANHVHFLRLVYTCDYVKICM